MSNGKFHFTQVHNKQIAVWHTTVVFAGNDMLVQYLTKKKKYGV